MTEQGIGADWGWGEQAAARFARYFELLVSWNERVNLTSVTEEPEVYVKHFYDSAWIRSLPEWQELAAGGGRAVDIGSGAGFPGLPLAILEPGIEFVLLDALRKRVAFLRAVAAELGIDNVSVVHARAEDAAREKGLRDGFDAVLARAVARLNVLAEYALPFARVGGRVFAYKGPGVEAELKDGEAAAGRLGGRVSRVAGHSLPDGLGLRSVVVLDKLSATPGAYPRKAGTPQRRPLAGR